MRHGAIPHRTDLKQTIWECANCGLNDLNGDVIVGEDGFKAPQVRSYLEPTLPGEYELVRKMTSPEVGGP